MSRELQSPTLQQENYWTTYNKKISFNTLNDFISLRYIDLYIDLIGNRLNISKDKISVSLSRGDHDINIYPPSLKAVFTETEKHNHQIKTIGIESGICHFNSVSHGSIEISIYIQGSKFKKFQVVARVYAVGMDRVSSQNIIDWGAGTIRDLMQLKTVKQQTNSDELIIEGSTGKVIQQWDAQDKNFTPVQVVNKINIMDDGFKELKRPQVYIPIGLAVIAILISVTIWLVSL